MGEYGPPPVTVAAIAGSLAAIAACVPPFPLLASDGVLGAVEGRKVVARFYGGAALLSHKQAVGAVKQGLAGYAFDPAYGWHKPNVHVTLGTLAAGASAAALQERLQEAFAALPPLVLEAVEFEDDNGGAYVPRGKRALAAPGAAPPPLPQGGRTLAEAGGFTAAAAGPSKPQPQPPQGQQRVTLLHLSDTHNLHRTLQGEFALPPADILVHTGDYTEHGTEAEVLDFNSWLGEQRPRYRAIIVINGSASASSPFTIAPARKRAR